MHIRTLRNHQSSREEKTFDSAARVRTLLCGLCDAGQVRAMARAAGGFSGGCASDSSVSGAEYRVSLLFPVIMRLSGRDVQYTTLRRTRPVWACTRYSTVDSQV